MPTHRRPTSRLPDLLRDVKSSAVRAAAIGWQNRTAFQLIVCLSPFVAPNGPSLRASYAR